jgi:hypothetical protein
MYCDGVRYAVEMLDVSYRRLVAGLEQVAIEDGQTSGDVPLLFLDAWAIVDSANRLRVLVEGFPGIKKKTAAHQFLVRTLAGVEPLRNSVQHLPGEIQENPGGEVPTWGVLHWVRVDSPDSCRAFLAVPGSIRSMAGLGKIRSPGGRTFHSNPDFVTLEAHGDEANLSGVYRAVTEWLPKFESALEGAFDPEPERTGSDLIVTMEFRVADGSMA